MSTFQYFAFISYQRKDEDWAEWLQHQLEHYHLPANVAADNPDIPQEIRPLFRDKTELAGGILANEIRSALESSRFLIVLCSPNSAKSEWVDKEVQTFINMGRVAQIIPLIIGGMPYDDEQECFTPTLRQLRKTDNELLGINIAEMGREVASIKVIAQMLGLKFDSLWQRYEREKEEEHQRMLETIRKIRIGQSRFVAEKASDLVNLGDSYLARRLLLKVLPTKEQPDWPYTVEADAAMRKACQFKCGVLKGHLGNVQYAVFSPNGKYIVSSSNDRNILVWDAETGRELRKLEGHTKSVLSTSFSIDGKQIASASLDQTIRIWDAGTGKVLRVLKGHQGAVNSVAYASNNKFLVSASNDKTVRIWDLQSGQEILKMEGHTDWVTSASFSPDCKRIASFSKILNIMDFVNIFSFV